MSLDEDNRKRIDLRIQVESRTTDGEVYHYLLANPNWDLRQGKAMVSQAVKDYWLADARQEANAELAKTTAMACIERMEHRIAQLRQRFRLEVPNKPLSEQSELVKLFVEISTELHQIPQALASISAAISNSGVSVQSISASSAIVPVEPAEPAVENLFSPENVDAMLDILGPLHEDLSSDPNSDQREEEKANNSDEKGVP